MKDYVSVLLIGYLFGLFQTSYLLGKLFFKVDVRTLGRGNAGASNATENLGFKFGLMVGLFDILKATLSILVIKVIYDVALESDGGTLLYLNGFGVILGHNFPFYMGFKGGKGTASLIGMLLGMNPILGLGGMLVIVIFSLSSDFIAIGTLALVIYVVIVTSVLGFGAPSLIISVAIGIMSIYLHRNNYMRIMKKEESRVSRVLGKKGRQKK